MRTNIPYLIEESFHTGKKQAEIARTFKVSRQYVHQICRDYHSPYNEKRRYTTSLKTIQNDAILYRCFLQGWPYKQIGRCLVEPMTIRAIQVKRHRAFPELKRSMERSMGRPK